MFLNIYSDASCTTIVANPVVGTYSIFKTQGLWTAGEYNVYTGTDEELTLTLQGATNRNSSLSSQLLAEGDIWCPSFEWGTYENPTRLQYYLSPRAYFTFELYKTDTNLMYVKRAFFAVRVRANVETWQAVNFGGTATEYIGSPGAEFVGFRFNAANKDIVQIYDSSAFHANGDYLGIDILYREPGQTGNAVRWNFISISKFQQYIGDDFPRPSYDVKNNVRRGGKGTGTVPRGTIPALPVHSINSLLMNTCQGRGRGLTYYCLKGEALSKVTNAMYPKVTLFEKSVAARRESFVSLIGIPYAVSTETNPTDSVFLADYQVPCGTGNANWLSDLAVEINFGKFMLAGNLSDTYADIVYTTYTLWLPGVGNMNIEPSACAQGYIRVDGILDLRNGNILYCVYTYADQNQGEVIYAHASGNIGVHIPLSGGTYSNNVASTVGMAMAGAATAMVAAVSGGSSLAVMGGLAAAGKGTMSTFEDTITMPHYDRSGAVDTVCGGWSTPGCRLVVSQNYLIMPSEYITLLGRPSAGIEIDNPETQEVEVSSKLGDYKDSGFLKVKMIKLDGIDATDEEKDELLRLLAEGVFI